MNMNFQVQQTNDRIYLVLDGKQYGDGTLAGVMRVFCARVNDWVAGVVAQEIGKLDDKARESDKRRRQLETLRAQCGSEVERVAIEDEPCS